MASPREVLVSDETLTAANLTDKTVSPSRFSGCRRGPSRRWWGSSIRAARW